MKNIFKFIKSNKIIFSFFIVSIVIIVSYTLTINLDWSTSLNEIKKWYNLLFQLAIGYIINFLFYITQIYIPNIRKNIKINKCINTRINHIIRHMDDIFDKLATKYIANYEKRKLSNDDFKEILKLKFEDNVNVLKANSLFYNKNEYFRVKEWLIKCICDVENEIDRLYKYYPQYISASLTEILEQILNSPMHTSMKTFFQIPNGINFSNCEDIFFKPYYELMDKLENIKQKEYN